MKMFIFIFLAASLFLATETNAQVYKYVDKDGNVHLTNTPTASEDRKPEFVLPEKKPEWVEPDFSSEPSRPKTKAPTPEPSMADPYTGRTYSGAIGGVIDDRTGRFLLGSGGVYFDPVTGKYLYR